MKKTKELKRANLIAGVRINNHFIKVFEEKDGKFLIVKKKYLFGVAIKTDKIIIEDYETVEDYMNNLKFEKRKII